MRLVGQHAVVTGGGTGIGAAIAEALAAEGARLTLIGRRQEVLDHQIQQLRSSRAKSRGVVPAPLDFARDERSWIGSAVANVTDRAQVDAAFSQARDAHGPISILVNNAGAAASAPFAEVSAEDWRGTFAVNADALLHTCQAALPDLLAAEHGRIVTIASTAGLKGYSYTAPYVAAKHAAIGLTRALAAEFAKTRLTVNAVCPGFTETEIVADAIKNIRQRTGRSEDEARIELARFNPQRRLVDPAEVASAVVWLCLPESRSITGQAIAVAGGEVMN